MCPDSRQSTDTRTSYVAEGSDFERDTDYIATRVTRDGEDG